MDSDSLKIFCTVAAELSITQAAARLGRVPSNVSTRVQQLEQEVDSELFVRSGKRLSLSGAGEQFLGYAQRLLALEEEAIQVVSDRREGGSLRIGSMESTAATRLPAVLARYHVAHPTTRLEVKTGPSRQLLEQVQDGRLDCALVATGQSAELALPHATIWTEELLLLAPATEKAARKAQDIRTRSLAAFANGCSYRTLAENWLGVNTAGNWRVQEVGSYHAMVACVAAGTCVALLTRSLLDLANVPAELHTLPLGSMPTVLVWREGYLTPVFEQFRHALEG